MKKLVTQLIFFFVFSASVLAQSQGLLWSHIHNITNDIDEAKSILQTPDGGYLITGSCVPNGMISAIDVLLLKTDDEGNISWTKYFDKGYVEEGHSLDYTSDGGYIIGGRHVPFLNPPDTLKCDTWILKINADGDTLWSRTIDDTESDYCTSIRETSDNGFILAGTVDSKHAYPPNCYLDINNHYTSKARLIKTDDQGYTQWSKTYLEGSYGSWVESTSDGGYVMVGTVVSGQQTNILLIKTDATGDTLWTRLIGATDSIEFGRCVRELPDGYIVAGHCGVTSGSDLCDGILVKTTLTGEILWKKKMGGIHGDSWNMIEVTQDGGFFLIGITNAEWYIHYGDMWVSRTNASGNILWEDIFDILGSDYAWCGIQNTTGNYIVAGMVSDGFGGDLWMGGIANGPTGVDHTPANNQSCRLYPNFPNPFSESTIINYFLPRTSDVRIQLCDISGRTIKTLLNGRGGAGYHELRLERQEVPVGLYLLIMQAGRCTSHQKIQIN
ncbi:MAG: T9SS type A sorting domain-containing protein [Bacteroidia bacterium]|nr:T9SS type A sorting domain-containing protein [Bacteroidia bacterium]